MSATARLVRKEFRALAGLWLAIAAAMLSGLLPLPRGGIRELGPVLYIIGALALGANAMGHEYRHGTFAQLLTQPIARSRVFAAKMAVLAALLAALAGVAAWSVFTGFRWLPADRDALIALFVLPLAYGFFVAPWLTLVTRNTLAGTLFSGALAALLLVGGNWAGTMRFDAGPDIDAFKLRVLWTGSALLTIFGAVGLWRGFARLQVADDVRSDVALPAVLHVGGGAVASRRHPIAVLVGKELRLQQMTFVAPFFYVLASVTLWARRGTMPAFEDAIGVATAINGLAVVALAGAFSCAEERTLNTLQWQLLQPVAARAQFAVKAAVTVALTLLLAIGLPVLVAVLLGIHARTLPSLKPGTAAAVVLLSGAIYVSSVSRSALAAFFSCIPALLTALWFQQAIVGDLAYRTFRAVHPPTREVWLRREYLAGAETVAIIATALVLLVLVLAFDNYRNLAQSPRRVALQVAAVAALFTVLSVAFAAAGHLLAF